MGLPQNSRRAVKPPAAVTTQEVAAVIAQAIGGLKDKFSGIVSSSTKELVQSHFAEFRSQMKEEFRTYLAEAMKQQQVTALAGSPGASTPTTPRPGSSTGSKGFFPTIEAVKKEIGHFRMLLDKYVEIPGEHVLL